MMKNVIAISVFAASILLVKCTAQKQVVYDFPAAMSEPVKAEFLKQCEKGRILYEINCGRCHTKKEGRKEIIPDFTPDQLKGYELRVTNAEHEHNITEESVTAEELGQIMTFLNYKKRNK